MDEGHRCCVAPFSFPSSLRCAALFARRLALDVTSVFGQRRGCAESPLDARMTLVRYDSVAQLLSERGPLHDKRAAGLPLMRAFTLSRSFAGTS